MIDRRHIEQILKLNGLSSEASDEEIKSLLISARWHENDVETAMVVLREDPKSHAQHIDSIHRVFNTDQRLNPDTINAILGIDVEVSDVAYTHRDELKHVYRMQIASIVGVSILIALVFLLSAMWFMKFGIFYEYV